MAITGINNSSYTSYYASNYKNTVKKATCDITKTKKIHWWAKLKKRVRKIVTKKLQD